MSELVTVGIPLNEDSGVASISQLGLTNVAEGQFRILTRWPNGNVHCVACNFLKGLAANGTDTTTALVPGSGNFGGANLAIDNGATIVINTGPAQFTIRKANFNVFDSVIVNGQTFVVSGVGSKLIMRNSTDVEYNSVNDANSTAVIVDNGPVMAVLKCTGKFKNAAAQTLAGYTLWLTFQKGSGFVKGAFAITHADAATYSYYMTFNSVEARVVVSLGTTKTAEFARKTDFVSGPVGDAETAYLYQGHSTDKEFDPIGAYLWKPPVPGTFYNGDSYAYDATQEGLLVQIGATNYGALGTKTDWTQGWGEFRDSTGKGVTVAERWMGAFWPAGFEFTGAGVISIETWGKRNTKTALALAFGKYDAREIAWDFHTAAVSNKGVLFRLQHPLIARAPLTQYMSGKMFFGQSGLVTPAQQTQFFTDLGKAADSPVLGDVIPPAINRYYSWNSGGGGNQTDFALYDLLDFVRTGFAGYYVRAEIFTHFVNNQIPHSDGPLPSSFDPDWLRGSSINGGYVEMEHANIIAGFIYYLMTGNEAIREGLTDYGEYMDFTDQPATPFFTMPNNPYQRAWDRKFRNNALIAELERRRGAPNTTFENKIFTTVSYYLDSRDQPPPGNPQIRGRNLERGYRYWDNIGYDTEGERLTSWMVPQIQFEAFYQVWRVLRDNPGMVYARFKEFEGAVTGTAQYVWNELWVTKNAGTALADFGFSYENPIDRHSAVPDAKWYISTDPYDGSRSAVWAFKETGDLTILSRANRLIPAITLFATTRSPSGLEANELMYAYFNTPLVKVVFVPSVVDNGGGSYTLTYTLPAGAEYEIRHSSKTIVETLGFDTTTRAYAFAPATNIPFFSATAIPNLPAATGSSQQVTVTGLGTGQTFFGKYVGAGE